MDPVQLIFPRSSLFLEFLVVRGVTHGLEGVEVLTAFGEQIVEASNETALILIVDQVKGIILPSLANRLEELFQCHLTLGLCDDITNHSLTCGELQVPNITKSQRDKRKSFARLEGLVDL